MTAKANLNAATADDIKNTSASGMSLATATVGESLNTTVQHRLSDTQKQAPMTTKDINTCEEMCSRKRNLASFMSDDLEYYISQEDEDHSFDRDDARGGKPMAEDGCHDEDPKTKRKIQNRAAQRAFRERKERYVKYLEKKIKYVQDSHIYSTTRLFNENRQLRSIVHTLELEINTIKGAPTDSVVNADIPLTEKKRPSQSWLTHIGPPIPLPVINSFPPTPLAPLKIHPSLSIKCSKNNTKNIAPIMPEEPKQKVQTKPLKSAKPPSFVVTGKEIEITASSKINKSNDDKSIKKANKSTIENTGQQFTFAITTPATLRAHSDNDLVRKNVQIEAVQLYPANCMFDHNNKQSHVLSPHSTPSSVVSSCSGNSCVSSPLIEEDEEDIKQALKASEASHKDVCNDLLLFDDQEKDKKSGLSDILKHFFDPTGNLDLSVFNTHTPNDWAMEHY